jgi:cholesterol oxidase
MSSLDLAVNFTRVADQPDDVGVYLQLCTLCGDCVTGCNVRAKNALAMHYLPLAKQQGTQIFTQIEVDHLVKWPDGGYVVHYTSYPSDGPRASSGVLHARGVIVAAGALGTPQILLRSRDYGLVLSETLGHYFSANAEVLGAGYNTDQQTDILGFGTIQDERAHIRVGPTVLSMADYREAPAGSAPFVIQEGAIPRALVDMERCMCPSGETRPGRRRPRPISARELPVAGCSPLRRCWTHACCRDALTVGGLHTMLRRVAHQDPLGPRDPGGRA